MVHDNEARGVIQRAMSALQGSDPDAYAALLASDAVEGRPQLGELFRGRENIVGMYRDVPEPPDVRWHRLRGSGELWVAEGVIEYGEGPVNLTAIFEVASGQIRRADLYFSPRMDSPAHHRPWAERFDWNA